MPSPVSWALIGAGRHPELRIAPALKAAANARIRGVWSQHADRAIAFAGRHGAERVYSDIAEAVADPEVEAVFISTPNSLHAEHTIAAARAGKHVLVEKPMAVAADEARAMVQAAREHGVTLGVGYHMRHHPVHAEARRRLKTGGIGEPIYATAAFVLFSFAPPSMPNSPWKSDPAMMGHGGALMGMGVHVVDLLRFLTQREVISVAAMSDGQRAAQPLDRLAQVLLELDGGVQAHLVCSGRFPFARNDAVLYGSRGRLVCQDAVDMNPGRGRLELTLPDGAPTIVHDGSIPDHFQAEVEAFGRAIRGGEPFQADGIDGLRAVEVTSAIVESLGSGRRVVVARTEP